jgi:hypothetical protein
MDARHLATVTARPPSLFLQEPKASERFWEFLTANIRNRITQRSYYKALGGSLDDVKAKGCTIMRA